LLKVTPTVLAQRTQNMLQITCECERWPPVTLTFDFDT